MNYETIADYANALIDEVIKVKEQNENLLASPEILLNRGLLQCVSAKLKNSSYVELFNKLLEIFELNKRIVHKGLTQDEVSRIEKINRDIFALQIGYTLTDRRELICDGEVFSSPVDLIRHITGIYENNLEEYFNYCKRNEYFLKQFSKILSESEQKKITEILPSIHNYIDLSKFENSDYSNGSYSIRIYKDRKNDSVNISLSNNVIDDKSYDLSTSCSCQRLFKGIFDYFSYLEKLHKNGKCLEFLNCCNLLKILKKDNKDTLSKNEFARLAVFEEKLKDIFQPKSDMAFRCYSDFIGHLYVLYQKNQLNKAWNLYQSASNVIRSYKGNRKLSPEDYTKKFKILSIFRIDEKLIWASVNDYVNYINNLFEQKDYSKVIDLHSRAKNIFDNYNNSVKEKFLDKWNKLCNKIQQIFYLDKYQLYFANYSDYINYVFELYRKKEYLQVLNLNQHILNHYRDYDKLSDNDRKKCIDILSVFRISDTEIWGSVDDYIEFITKLLAQKEYIKALEIHRRAVSVFNNLSNEVKNRYFSRWDSLNNRLKLIIIISNDNLFASYTDYLEYANGLFRDNKLNELYNLNQVVEEKLNLSSHFIKELPKVDREIYEKIKSLFLGHDGVIYLCVDDYMTVIEEQYKSLFNAKEYIKLKNINTSINKFLSKNNKCYDLIEHRLHDWNLMCNDIFILSDDLAFPSLDNFFNKYLKKINVQKSKHVETNIAVKKTGLNYFFSKILNQLTSNLVTKFVTETNTTDEYIPENVAFLNNKKSEIFHALKNTPFSLYQINHLIELCSNVFSDNQNILLDCSVKFGNYYQNTKDKKEPIEWLVLDVVDNKRVLLLSRYALDGKSYNNECTDVTWENCDLRKWLNSEFINNAFSKDEQEKIILSDILRNDYPQYHTKVGNNTKDRIFLLSLEEVEKYFKSSKDRECKPTKYAIENDAYVNNGNCYWWLRSPGCSQYNAAFVSSDGDVNFIGDDVDYDSNALRVALWVNLQS